PRLGGRRRVRPAARRGGQAGSARRRRPRGPADAGRRLRRPPGPGGLRGRTGLPPRAGPGLCDRNRLAAPAGLRRAARLRAAGLRRLRRRGLRGAAHRGVRPAGALRARRPRGSASAAHPLAARRRARRPGGARPAAGHDGRADRTGRLTPRLSGRTPLEGGAMDQALQIIARGPREKAEAAAAAIDADPALEGATYSILEEDEDRGVWRIDAYPNSDEEAEALKTALAPFGLKVVVEALADADWLAMALSGLPPVRAGRFFVYGAHDRGKAPPSTVNLRIEAGAAFGTGHHGTTVGCLAAYDALLKARGFPRVLDVGCGTGVLGIAAARTGSRLVKGTDIDPVSVRIARENAALNRAKAGFVH